MKLSPLHQLPGKEKETTESEPGERNLIRWLWCGENAIRFLLIFTILDETDIVLITCSGISNTVKLTAKVGEILILRRCPVRLKYVSLHG
jgi:uncharacterized metal-binding protein